MNVLLNSRIRVLIWIQVSAYELVSVDSHIISMLVWTYIDNTILLRGGKKCTFFQQTTLKYSEIKISLYLLIPRIPKKLSVIKIKKPIVTAVVFTVFHCWPPLHGRQEPRGTWSVFRQVLLSKYTVCLTKVSFGFSYFLQVVSPEPETLGTLVAEKYEKFKPTPMQVLCAVREEVYRSTPEYMAMM